MGAWSCGQLLDQHYTIKAALLDPLSPGKVSNCIAVVDLQSIKGPNMVRKKQDHGQGKFAKVARILRNGSEQVFQANNRIRSEQPAAFCPPLTAIDGRPFPQTLSSLSATAINTFRSINEFSVTVA
jgi:hypothetical protein